MDFDDSNISSVIEMHDDGKPHIFVSNLLSPAQKRFAIAHELGHHFPGHLRREDNHQIVDDMRMFNSTFWEQRENEANNFATNLLIPAGTLENLVIKGFNFVELIEKFDVPKKIMYMRLNQLKIIQEEYDENSIC